MIDPDINGSFFSRIETMAIESTIVLIASPVEAIAGANRWFVHWGTTGQLSDESDEKSISPAYTEASRAVNFKRNSFSKHGVVNQALFNNRNKITCDGKARERFAGALHVAVIRLTDRSFDDF